VQFVIIARDGTDAGAASRRQEVRPAHLDGIRPLVERGHVPLGGAILDAEGQMVGSVMVVEFPTREDLDAWLSSDPYVTAGVWQEIEVHPYRAAVGSWLPA
jgi:uncharacterized protein YciI